MKTKLLAGIAFLAITLSACDDTTETIGTSLISNMDNLEVTSGSFRVQTRSIVADSVLSRNNTGYLGKIKDPETGSYITGDFVTQYHTIESFSFPELDSVASRLNNEVIADSCDIYLYYSNFYGDSLATMKVTAYELSRPMEENTLYYSNFDPEAEGYVSTNGLKKDKVYTLTNLIDSEDTRNDESYVPGIRILLNEPYTDKDGNSYNNYGTYLLRKYYENPSYFKDSYQFIHHICPGFYFKTQSGLGSMAYIQSTMMRVYLRYTSKGSVKSGSVSFAGTEEVMQSTRITNDENTIRQLVADNSCTYLKSPAGIFTEMTLPVDEITYAHENDTLNSAQIVLTRINNESHTGYELDLPNELLLVQKDSLYSFFENSKLPNNRTSFLITRDYTTETISSTTTKTVYKNTYTFNNIANLIRILADNKANGGSNYTTEHPDWNKVVIVPVTASYTTKTVNGASVKVVTKVVNNMSLSSTKLVGGSDNQHEDIKIDVIYSKFKQK